MRIRTWMFLLAGVLLLSSSILRQPSGVPFYGDARYSDLLISHLPHARFLNISLTQWGQIPFWNPTIYAGAPFVADPLSGLTYPPTWIAGVFPLPITFNLLVFLHLLLSAVGCYTLARKLNMSPTAAVICGLAFAGTPKFFAHIGLGHISLLFAVCWTPWMLLGVFTLIQGHASLRDWPRVPILTGGVQGLIFLADPRWSLPSLILAMGFGLHLWVLKPSGERKFVPLLKPVLVAGGAALGIAAVLAIPLWQYLQLTTRANLTIMASETLALGWEHLLGLVSPILSQAEQVTYLGVVVLMLAVVGLLSRKQGAGFWGVVFILALSFSLGSSTPLFPLITRWIPGAGFLRVPSRALFLVALAAAFLAGYGYDHLLQPQPSSKAVNRIRMTSLIIVTLAVVLNLGLTVMGMGTKFPQLMAIAVSLIAGILIWISQFRRDAKPWLMPSLIALTLIDLVCVSWVMIRKEPFDILQEERLQLAGELTQPYGERRIFSPSYSIPQLTAVDASLELVDGVNPLQLSTFADYLQRATGFERLDYGVTLPPFPHGDPDKPWQVKLNPTLFSQLNAEFVISEYVLEDPHLNLVDQEDGAYIYRFDQARSRAWIDGDAPATTRVVSWSPNRITLTTEGPGKLILSEIGYPGWIARMDGQDIPIELHDGLFRSVKIPAGQHEVVFVFRPSLVFLGLAITSLTVLLGVLLVWKR